MRVIVPLDAGSTRCSVSPAMFCFASLGILIAAPCVCSDPAPVVLNSIVFPVAADAALAAGPDGLDFWVGTWDCVGRSKIPGKDGWSETKCANRIEKILGDKVIHENFENAGYAGQSWSVYNVQTKQWHQTWVDSQGAYIDLFGGLEKDKMILRTVVNPKKPKAFNRMVFSDITKNSFNWRWEGTKDGGKTWTTQWILDYKRRPA